MQKKMNEEDIRVIYVAGYGHSGSTILEILLSCSKNTVGMGEIVRIPCELNASYTKLLFKRNFRCAKIYDRIEAALEPLEESLQSIDQLNTYENLFTRKTTQRKQRYQQYWTTFLSTITNDPNQPVKTIIDSSKTSFAHALRPYHLQSIDGIDVAMIHVVRHPRAILHRLKEKAVRLSNRNEPKWVSEIIQVFKTTLNWTFSNIYPAIVSSKLDKYVRVSFEELCEFPIETLKRIEIECQIDLSETIRRIENDKPLPSTCGIAGNIGVKKKDEELRFQPSKKMIPKTGFMISFISMFLIPIYKFLCR